MAKIPQYVSQQSIIEQSAIPDMPNVPTIGEGLERAGNIVAGTMLENQSREHQLWISRSRQQIQTQLWKLGETFQDRINKGEFTDETAADESYRKEAQRITDKADPNLMKYIKADLDQTAEVNMAEGRKFVRAYRSEQQKQIIIEGVGNALKMALDPTTSEEKRNLLIEQTRKSIFETPDVSIEWKNKTFEAFKGEIYGSLFDNALANDDFQTAASLIGNMPADMVGRANTSLTKAKLSYDQSNLADDFILRMDDARRTKNLSAMGAIMEEIRSNRKELGGNFDSLVLRSSSYDERIKYDIEQDQRQTLYENNLRSQRISDSFILRIIKGESVPQEEIDKSGMNDQDMARVLNAYKGDIKQDEYDAFRDLKESSTAIMLRTVDKSIEDNADPEKTLLEIKNNSKRLYENSGGSNKVAILAHELYADAFSMLSSSKADSKKRHEMALVFDSPPGTFSNTDMQKGYDYKYGDQPMDENRSAAMFQDTETYRVVPDQLLRHINAVASISNYNNPTAQDRESLTVAANLYGNLERMGYDIVSSITINKGTPGLSDARDMWLYMKQGQGAEQAFGNVNNKHTVSPELAKLWDDRAKDPDLKVSLDKRLESESKGNPNLFTLVFPFNRQFFMWRIFDPNVPFSDDIKVKIEDITLANMRGGDDFASASEKAILDLRNFGLGISSITGTKQYMAPTPESVYGIESEKMKDDLHSSLEKLRDANGKPLYDLGDFKPLLISSTPMIGGHGYVPPRNAPTGGKRIKSIELYPIADAFTYYNDQEQIEWDIWITVENGWRERTGLSWNFREPAKKIYEERKAAEAKRKMELTDIPPREYDSIKFAPYVK